LLLLADIDLSLDFAFRSFVGTFVWESNWCLVEWLLVPQALLVIAASFSSLCKTLGDSCRIGLVSSQMSASLWKDSWNQWELSPLATGGWKAHLLFGVHGAGVWHWSSGDSRSGNSSDSSSDSSS